MKFWFKRKRIEKRIASCRYRDSEKDWLEKLEKVRKPKEKFITEVK
jgi:hypothetical protein